MGAKIYNVGLNNIHIRSQGQLGPGFYIDTVRTFSNFYPAVGDWTSGSTSQFRPNMGQNTFLGDPLGFQPYDSNYSDSKWFGAGGVSNGVVTPGNIDMMLYDKQYTSGKYYFEVEFVTSSLSAVVFHDGSSTYSGTIRNKGVGAAFYTNKAITWLNAFNDDTDFDWALTGTGAGIGSGEFAQVYADFDNQLLCVRKLNTTKDQYVNFIEL